MATKEQSMRKWISEMDKYELQHIRMLVDTHQSKLLRIELSENER